MKFRNFVLFLLGNVFLISCTISVKETTNERPYFEQIGVWYFKELQYSFMEYPDYQSGKYYIFWDQNSVCQTYTSGLIDILKEFPEVILVRNFEKEEDIDLFRSTYKIENQIHHIDLPNRYQFHTPFAFKLVDVPEKDYYTIKHIFAMGDKHLNVDAFSTYKSKNNKRIYFEYDPDDWLTELLTF